MQSRHTDRKRYFEESARSSARYYLPYIAQYHPVSGADRVLEVGCGGAETLNRLPKRAAA